MQWQSVFWIGYQLLYKMFAVEKYFTFLGPCEHYYYMYIIRDYSFKKSIMYILYTVKLYQVVHMVVIFMMFIYVYMVFYQISNKIFI